MTCIAINNHGAFLAMVFSVFIAQISYVRGVLICKLNLCVNCFDNYIENISLFLFNLYNWYLKSVRPIAPFCFKLCFLYNIYKGICLIFSGIFSRFVAIQSKSSRNVILGMVKVMNSFCRTSKRNVLN